MSEPLKVHYKVGDIEFEAEGSAEDVEKQRQAFMNELLPEAVNAVIKTHSKVNPPIINTVDPILLPPQTEIVSEDTFQVSENQGELARESLASFCNSFGNLIDQDFLLAAAYFDEKKNNVATFSIDSARRYYQEARRPEHSNLSLLINRTIGKGYIMDAPKTDGISSKLYALTANGIRRVENKELSITNGEKKTTKKPKKAVQKKTLNLLRFMSRRFES
ncbi:MAG: hypothetical protein CVV04_10675 [Firmicutes bacterium HGW-Firmicutes-9]|jgi:hypothetical protein|nr:MAG: hypothetical protein CVV04_10675 [Firmicutes bacterium HGW-Firmicutes-9]